MTLYTFDPRQMIRQIVVVGLGGTGSHVARNLARLLYHRRENRQSVPDMLFVDPDIVESSNLGRQLFAPADLNQSKAVAGAMCSAGCPQTHPGRCDCLWLCG